MQKINNSVSIYRFSICIVFGIIIALIGPYTDAPIQGWYIFSVFISVILSFILKALPMGMAVITGLFVLSITKVIEFKEALSSYSDSTVWLVLAAFLIANGVISSGLGKRISLQLIYWFGKNVFGIAYAICLTELILAPVVPSNTARGGGILAPIVDSLSKSFDSSPQKNPHKIGSYLTLLGAHANLITSAMFLTAMAANPIIAEGIKDILGINFDWLTWAKGAFVPGIIGLCLLPFFIYLINKPTISLKVNSKKIIVKEIKKIGIRPNSIEKIMFLILLLIFSLWTSKAIHGIGTSEVAWIGVLAMLVFKVQSWEDIIKNYKAWDTFIWLGGLLTISILMAQYGIIDWFVREIKVFTFDFKATSSLIIISLIYFYSMYLFSMLTAHISAFALPLMALALFLKCDPILIGAILAYFSCLCGCLTNYSTGPVIVYFGLGYVSNNKWYKTGILMSVYHIIIWLGIGMVWWKFIGWW